MSNPYRTAPIVEAHRLTLSDRLRCLVGSHGRTIARLNLTGHHDLVPVCERCGRFVLVGRIELDRFGEVWRGGGAMIDFDGPAREWLRGRANFDLLVCPASVWGRAWAVTIETPDDIRNA